MRQALFGFGALIVAACGPDLADNDALRCDDTLTCGAGLSCYRGFCVPDDVIDAPPGQVSVDPVLTEDAGQTLPEPDAGQANELFDAAQAEPDAAPIPETPAPVPPTAPEPPAPAVDAGVPGTGKCTLKECCDEARKAYEDSKDDDDYGTSGPNKGKCGCRQPDLFNTLTCGLGSLTGLT